MSQLEAVVVCPCCEREVPVGHQGRRGILINKSAALGAKITELHWQLQRVPESVKLLRISLQEQLDRATKEWSAVEDQLKAEPA